MRFSGVVYRAHNPEWSWAPSSGAGAAKHGGRFNAKGMAALYTSLRIETAILEASPLGRPFQPLTLVAYAVDVAPVFDALDGAALAKEGVRAEELACPHWRRVMLEGGVPASHDLAARLRAAGYAGLRVASFAIGAGPDDLNLVLWSWGETLPARVRVIDDDGRLPRDGASWRT